MGSFWATGEVAKVADEIRIVKNQSHCEEFQNNILKLEGWSAIGQMYFICDVYWGKKPFIYKARIFKASVTNQKKYLTLLCSSL